MPKAIKTVKNKTELQTLLKNINGVGKSLLEQWINLDPIYVGVKTKANYEDSIKKHLLDTTKTLTVDGYWCEFGVREGRSLHWLIDEYPTQPIHAFDSWQGLPEDWDHGQGKVADMSCDPPKVPDRVKLYKGWFKDTIPSWQSTHKDNISFLHMDADIYSSTKEVLTNLNNQIVPGTVITFDEFTNFRLSGKMSKWREHEFKALVEWLDENNREVKPLNRNWAYQASCVVVS
tara:strand:- start:4788 stop:5483 length:696 start_codon:yes stop_codon:yes gene_type:complete